jgi:hypothetical protein
VTFQTTTCRSCGATIVWAETVSGVSMPVDAAPHPEGNVQLLQPDDPRSPPFATVYGKRKRPPPGAELRMPHHSTCPDAEQWRRR